MSLFVMRYAKSHAIPTSRTRCSPRAENDVAILIDGPPEVVPYTIDGEKHLVQVLLGAGSGTPAPELIGIGLPELQAPLADPFVGHHDPTD